MRRIYSTQKIKSVVYSIALKILYKKASSSKVSKKVTVILEKIVIVMILQMIVKVMKISNARLIRLLLSPI